MTHPVRLPELLDQRSLEGQVADAADEIAYLNHDLDDAFRAELLTFEMVEGLPHLGTLIREIDAQHISAPDPLRRSWIVRGMIDALVTDLVTTSVARVEAQGLESPDEVRRSASRSIILSDELDGARRELKTFLFDRFYNHPTVLSRTRRAEAVVEDLFRAFFEDPGRLPAGVRERCGVEGEVRAIADYIAGMTDRFALSEHRQVLGSERGVDL